MFQISIDLFLLVFVVYNCLAAPRPNADDVELDLDRCNDPFDAVIRAALDHGIPFRDTPSYDDIVSRVRTEHNHPEVRSRLLDLDACLHIGMSETLGRFDDLLNKVGWKDE